MAPRSVAEVRERRRVVMGSELGDLYHALSDDITWLHAKWNQYRQLYGHSAERVDILNRAAVHFFAIAQEALWENVLLHLSRLTDPPETCGRANRTLIALSSAIPDAALAREVAALAGQARDACSSSRDWRNRRLAHSDLSLALGEAQPLQGVSRAKVEEALRAIRAVLHRVESHYLHSETIFQDVIVNGGEGDSVIHYLRLGLRAEELRRKRILEGRALPEDLDVSDDEDDE